MENLYDYKRFAILYVDDEEKSLKYFSRAFADTFQVLTASNAADGYRLLEANADSIGIVMSDQRMPGEKGVQFLQRARSYRPRIIRILVTAFTDLDAAIDAVNTGAIYKYITKPWEVPTLETTLKRSLEFFMVQRERDALLREKLSVLHNLVITDRVLSLGVLAAGLGDRYRNALPAVRAFLSLAPDFLRGVPMDLSQLRQPDFWEVFHQHINRSVQLVAEMLPAGSSAASVPTLLSSADIATLINESAVQAAAAKGIRTESNLPLDLATVSVPADRLRQLLMLLLRCQAGNLPDGATVQITARNNTPADGTAAGIAIELADNGPGLPLEAIESVFNPFQIRNPGPNETGLALLASFIAGHHFGAEIQLATGATGGLVFKVIIPSERTASTATDEAQAFLVAAMTNERLWDKLIGTL